MNDFIFYLTEGIQHILDINGLDHCLFVTLLATRFNFNEWRKLVLLLSAFTLGHSISLFLGNLLSPYINSDLIELLIPITIIAMGVQNILFSKKQVSLFLQLSTIFSFGLIHGLGFSSFFRAMMMGISNSIVVPLFSFNLGIEIGQLIILSALLLPFFFLNKSKNLNYWRMIVINTLGILISILWLFV